MGSGDICILPAGRMNGLPPVGEITAAGGRAAYDAILAAIKLARDGRVAAMVTAPIHKEALAAAGVDYPGHTEILADHGGAGRVAMMLANDEIRTVLVTIHCALRDAIERADFDAQMAAMRLAREGAAAFGIANPRVAVAGLNPDDVAIIDSSGELLSADFERGADGTSDDRADRMRDRVQRLLEARVGFGNAVVEVSVEAVTESESIRQRTFDPAGRVAISTETEERTGTAQNEANDVTVASNLPDGEAGGGDQSTSQSSETRERVNYEVSETEREVMRAAGAVKRLSVAVLVNGVPVGTGDGEPQMQPRDAEELAALRDLVASAVGFDESRGDVITIKSMLFEEVVPEGSLATNSWAGAIAPDPMALIQMGLLALVTLILGLFVVRPVLRSPGAPAQVSLPAPDGIDEGDDGALTGEIEDDDFSLPDLPIVSNFDTGGMGGFEPDASDDPVDRLKSLIGERRDETVEILRGWLEDRGERAG